MDALLVVDVQKGLVEKPLYRKGPFLGAVKGALGKCRLDGRRIIFIQHVNKQLAENSEPWELAEGLERSDADLAIVKRHGNAFDSTGLGELLRKDGIDHVFVCGLVSHGCVRATCLGGLAEGFSVSLLENGHSCWGSDAEEKVMRTERELASAGVRIMKELP